MQPPPTDKTVNPSATSPSASIAALPSSTFLSRGRDMSEAALTEMFRAVFKRKGLKRVPGPQGELKKVVNVGGNGKVEYLRGDWGAKGEWPVGMKVQWEE